MRDARSRATARAIVLSGGIVAAALALASASAAAEPYRLEPGDVLEFSVPAIPELNQQAMVDVDGGVTLPLFGSLPVTGLTLPGSPGKGAAACSRRGRSGAPATTVGKSSRCSSPTTSRSPSPSTGPST